MEAGDGYRAQPNVSVLNNRNAREGAAALPYTEVGKRNEYRHVVRPRLQHRIQQRPALRIQCMSVHNLKPAAIGIHYQNVRIA